ncbi:uncharacterized protein FOMMEDRAFT_16926 [Fomitiporia mediterranea MF3/22]|uniref:uncharacterized protein n=1 Tax=Fomitiporia mediterranea (strain MF3/22) TaxID=694068 RepID=UPI0004408926|nr:uncharacterized protein FOMMEDRAFT_16926 [Fomitiporia mediterranea MF3/22]EJD06309.1 hypothetical protein FOMMEDRAFT_16926 [Fomitiporia mediterranea MF3/22]
MGTWEGVARRFFNSQRRSGEHYELVPSEDGLPTRRASPTPWRPQSFRFRSLRVVCFACLHLLTLRRIFAFLLTVLAFLVLGILWSGIPPSYASIREFERRLPQHNVSLPFPEGKDGMYLRFPEHLWGHGLNNIMQEFILMSHLAYLSNRSFVFEDYTWSKSLFPYTIYDFALRPSRIPLNAFISGPSAGGPMHAPRAVSAEYWETVCPPSKRVRISSAEAPNLEEGGDLLSWWVERLKTTPDGCVEVGNDPPVFSWFLFGSERILSLWPSLSESPIIQDFAWSPLVTSGVARNLALLSSTPAAVPPDTIHGLVAVHLRRGDYIRHCPRLALWGATYLGFNQFPELPDRFSPPEFGALDSLDGREKYYMQHCWPEIDDIVTKLHHVRKDRPDLHRVYVLTNGWGWWVDRLRMALEKDGWTDLKSSLDVQVDNEQKYVAMAIDMAIAERAEVFVGNGFSSLSSNIVMLRTAKKMDPRSNRFW